ncbi:serine hydrolase [Propioniciclava soli]|uniref:Serine hydrolase n=1 Tax=Propioniciclava soli TaxID=2775081 RepID=A0ABZ3C8K6_9ACTN
MALQQLDTARHGSLRGEVDERVVEIADTVATHLGTDPDLSVQVAAFHDGQKVLDVWGGPHLGEDSLIVPASVSKNAIGVAVGLLVERGALGLDDLVADHWPEFAARGKGAVTVRQLLSHQAGLPFATDPPLIWDDLLDPHRAARVLAAQRPQWAPGKAFGYHGVTIDDLAGELVYRVTGQTLQEFHEAEVRTPFGTEFFLGLPAGAEERLVAPLPMIPPVAAGGADGPGPDRGRLYWVDPVGDPIDIVRDERSWRFGHAAVSATVSARGIAGLLASAVTGVGERPALWSADTVEQMAQLQCRGYDEVLGLPDRAHSIVFQKQSGTFAWGGPRSFGHDGAFGCLGCVDPDTGVAFGYTIARGPWPGGADPRAVRLARRLGLLLAR